MALTDNRAKIQALLDGINALPDAGSGGGASLETCEVTVSECKYVFYTGIENGEPVAKVSQGSSSHATHNITVCRNTAIACGVTLNEILSTSSKGYTQLSGFLDKWACFSCDGETATLSFASSGGSID